MNILEKIKNIPIYCMRIVCAFFVLSLPIGYYEGDPDSTKLIVGAHVGRGQVASVIRGCEGNVLSSTKSTYTDLGGFVYYPIWANDYSSPAVIGIRGGYLVLDASFARRGYSYPSSYSYTTARRNLKFWHLTPNINLESKYVGLGYGYKFGNMPYKFNDLEDENDHQDAGNYRHSGHFRLGNIEKAYFYTSIGENSSIISGGDIFNIGIGYSSAKKAQGFTGFCGGFYDRWGVVQQFRFRLNHSLALDLNLRYGQGGDVLEGSISTGLIYRY